MKNNKNKKMSGNMNADNIWIYKLEDCGCGIVIADNKEQAIDKVINAYLNHNCCHIKLSVAVTIPKQMPMNIL